MGLKADVTNSQRMLVLQFLLESCKNGRPPRGKIAEAAARYNIGRQSVQRIWKNARAQRAVNEVISVEKKKRNRKLKHVINYAQIEVIEVIEGLMHDMGIIVPHQGEGIPDLNM